MDRGTGYGSAVRPLPDKVVLRALPKEDIAEMLGSLWLPQSVADQQRYMIGEVAFVGKGCELIPGLRVVHRQFHYVELPNDLRMFWEYDILAVLKKGADGVYTVVPLRNQIVIEEHPPDEHEGLIVLLEDTLDKPQRGTVLAVGPGLPIPEGGRMPMDVAKGDTVCYTKFAGTKLSIDGSEVLILDEDKVLAKLEEKKT
ncbi:hypothetical protein LCGC14_2914700 [marine sediment metagenome]|uniref:10 kDa chaperonin n=1 Tax=marine sediment metagenome TaxID=412755 RepID=A0A0F8ZYC6_9ZZZZ